MFTSGCRPESVCISGTEMLKRLFLIPILLLAASVWFSCEQSDPESVRIENQDTREVTAPSGLVLREEPNTKSVKLALIPLGTRVQVLEEKSEAEQIGDATGRWLRVNHNGIRGWVFGAYLKNIQPAD